MKKRITEYRKRVDRLLADEEEKTYEEWECILEEHLVQIGFFQHERLIHLIVTVTFAVITVLSLFAPLLTGIMTLYGFTMLLLVLLVPLIFHYYTLENETQKMYAQYDEIIKHTKKVNSGNLKKI